jgi:hypothetical protein
MWYPGASQFQRNDPCAAWLPVADYRAAQSFGCVLVGNLAQDATQTRDRAGAEPERVQDMAERWQRWAMETGLKR